MPRFVILTHDHPFLHWDLMLEHGSTLRTWRLLEEPTPSGPTASQHIRAERLPDHRLKYLDYEGPVSDDRGHVSRWDFGEYTTLAESEARLELTLAGQKLNGTAIIEQHEAVQTTSFYFRSS